MQPHSRLRAPFPLLRPRGRLTDSARNNPKLGRGSGFEGRVASLARCLPLQPRAGSPSAPRGTRSPQRSWCAPGPRRGSATARAPEGAFRQTRAGSRDWGPRWELLEPAGVSLGVPERSESPGSGNSLRCAGLSACLASGGVNGLGIGRCARIFTARSSSGVRSGQRC